MGDIGPQRRRYEVLPDPLRSEDVRERRQLEREAVPAERQDDTSAGPSPR
jgi:hypothetical protein